MERVSEPDRPSAASKGGPDQVRAISDVETLRAVADPTRLSILSTLMMRRDGDLPVMSVKELAADLSEPQTKLYRHVKQLEAVGLIKAVASRVVSGIVEQRYQACQSDLRLGGTLTRTREGSDAVEAATAAALEVFRSEFFAAHRARLAEVSPPTEPDLDEPDRSILNVTRLKLSTVHAESILRRLRQIIEDMTAAEAELGAAGDEDVITVNLLLGFFSPDLQKRP